MDRVTIQIFEAAAKVGNEWSLASFVVAALFLLYYFYLKRKRIPKSAERVFPVITGAILIVAVMPYLSRAYLQGHGVYRLRITVEDPLGVPVDNARVISSVGGEQKQVAGGWEVDIPSTSRPSDGRITIYAEVRSAFLTGRTDVVLSSEYTITANVHLVQDRSARLVGQVVDRNGRAISGAQITVVGYESEAVITHVSGQFGLPAHAADGQQVQIIVVRKGLGSLTQWVQAGEHPVTVVLR